MYEIERIAPVGKDSVASIIARQITYENTKNNKNNKIFEAQKLSNLYWSKKYQKYRLEIELYNYGKRHFWITEKQFADLEDSFFNNKFSTENRPVYVALTVLENGKFHYIWSGYNKKGLDFLTEEFNATLANIDYK